MAAAGVDVSAILGYVANMVSGSRTAEGDTGLAAVIKTPTKRKVEYASSGAFSGDDSLEGTLGQSGRVVFRKEPSLLMIGAGIFVIWLFIKKGF